MTALAFLCHMCWKERHHSFQCFVIFYLRFLNEMATKDLLTCTPFPKKQEKSERQETPKDCNQQNINLQGGSILLFTHYCNCAYFGIPGIFRVGLSLSASKNNCPLKSTLPCLLFSLEIEAKGITPFRPS